MTGHQQGGLALGTPVRSRRASLKRAIRDGRVDLAAVLNGTDGDDAEEVALAMAIVKLLEAVPGIGPDAVGRIIEGRRIYPHTRLGDVTLRTRKGLADSLRKELAP